jgi:hypothetical protein
MATEATTVEASGRECASRARTRSSSPRGETKLDLVRYYQAVEEPLLRTMGGRPTMMQRFPDGASREVVLPEAGAAGAPDWLETTEVSTPNGTTSNALVVADLAHLLWAVNLGCLGFHPWPYLAAAPEVADELRIDLDPSPGVTFDQVRAAAFAARRRCSTARHHQLREDQRQQGPPHLRAPRAALDLLRRAGRRRGGGPGAGAPTRPDLITAQWWKEERGDPGVRRLQPERAPQDGVRCLVRAPARRRPGVDPDHLGRGGHRGLDALTIATVPQNLAADGDPWADSTTSPRTIEPLLAWYDRDLETGHDGRAVAAAVPEAAQRTAAGGPQPSPPRGT